jgi:predicted DNA-binding transcriptional regulator YafY
MNKVNFSTFERLLTILSIVRKAKYWIRASAILKQMNKQVSIRTIQRDIKYLVANGYLISNEYTYKSTKKIDEYLNI